MVYLSAEQLRNDDFTIQHDSILLPFILELHRYPFLHCLDNDASDTEADSDNACVDIDQPRVRTWIYGTPDFENRLAVKTISNEYFDIVDDEIDLWSQSSFNEAYRVGHWCIKHNLSWAAINENFRNPMIATISNFTSAKCIVVSGSLQECLTRCGV